MGAAMSDKTKLTPAEIDRMAKAQNRQELLRQQSLDRIAEAAKKAAKEAQQAKSKK